MRTGVLMPLLTAAMPAADTPPLRCEIVTLFTDLVERAPAWLDLLRRSSTNEPMLAPQWLLPWWEIYGANTGRRLCAGFFYDEGNRLVGLAPLQARCYWYRPGVPFRRLELLGADEERDGVCSDYLSIIAERGCEERVVGQLTASLCEGAFGPWDEFVLTAMDGNGRMPGVLLSAFRRAGVPVATHVYSAAPYVQLPRSWEEYLQALGKDRRYVLKTLRDFDAWAEGSAAYHVATTAEELEAGKKILQELHSERWQAAGQKGVFHSDRFSRFHDQTMRLFFEKGALQLHWLTAHGRPLAAIYNLCWDNKVYFYQSGRALDVPKNVRPGIVLHAHCIREAIAAGRREYDFLGGESQYKKQLALASRPILEFRAVAAPWREKARRAGEGCLDIARRARRWLRARFSQTDAEV